MRGPAIPGKVGYQLAFPGIGVDGVIIGQSVHQAQSDRFKVELEIGSPAMPGRSPTGNDSTSVDATRHQSTGIDGYRRASMGIDGHRWASIPNEPWPL
jgi:hypothetical protein